MQIKDVGIRGSKARKAKDGKKGQMEIIHEDENCFKKDLMRKSGIISEVITRCTYCRHKSLDSKKELSLFFQYKMNERKYDSDDAKFNILAILYLWYSLIM